jgi:hypothetical protein
MNVALTTAMAAYLVTASFSGPQNVQHLSAADFLSGCTKPAAELTGFCQGYVQAVVDGLHRPGEDFCPPVSISRAKIVGDVVDQLQANPGLRNASAYSVVYAYLVVTFPCA